MIEDDVDSGDAMSLLLRAHGIQVAWARSGREAIEHCLRRNPVDVILVDLMLPDMDGASLIDELSKHMALPPVVIHSAASEAHVKEMGHQMEALAILRKPTDWGKLLKILEGCRPAAATRPASTG